MSIEMPEGLQWLSYLAGASWPKGDEDKLFALGDDWHTAADSLSKLVDALHTACDTATANYSGGGADKMKAQFDKFFTGDQSVAEMAKRLKALGDSVRECGTQIEYAKLQIIVTLAILAAEIAYALATLWGALTVPALEAEAVGVCQIIGRRLATMMSNHAASMARMPLWKLAAISGGTQAGIGLAMDLGIQGYQVGKGHRDHIDVKQALISGAVGGISGAVAAPVGSIVGKRLGNWVGPQGMTWWKAGGIAIGAGVPAGVAGAGAGIVANGLFTGEWEFDPAAILGGVAGGFIGGVHGVTGHMRSAALEGRGYTGLQFTKQTLKLAGDGPGDKSTGTDGSHDLPKTTTTASSDGPKSRITDLNEDVYHDSPEYRKLRSPSVHSTNDESGTSPKPSRSVRNDSTTAHDQQSNPQTNGRNGSRSSAVRTDNSAAPTTRGRSQSAPPPATSSRAPSRTEPSQQPTPRSGIAPKSDTPQAQPHPVNAQSKNSPAPQPHIETQSTPTHESPQHTPAEQTVVSSQSQPQHTPAEQTVVSSQSQPQHIQNTSNSPVPHTSTQPGSEIRSETPPAQSSPLKTTASSGMSTPIIDKNVASPAPTPPPRPSISAMGDGSRTPLGTEIRTGAISNRNHLVESPPPLQLRRIQSAPDLTTNASGTGHLTTSRNSGEFSETPPPNHVVPSHAEPMNDKPSTGLQFTRRGEFFDPTPEQVAALDGYRLHLVPRHGDVFGAIDHVTGGGYETIRHEFVDALRERKDSVLGTFVPDTPEFRRAANQLTELETALAKDPGNKKLAAEHANRQEAYNRKRSEAFDRQLNSLSLGGKPKDLDDYVIPVGADALGLHVVVVDRNGGLNHFGPEDKPPHILVHSHEDGGSYNVAKPIREQSAGIRSTAHENSSHPEGSSIFEPRPQRGATDESIAQHLEGIVAHDGDEQSIHHSPDSTTDLTVPPDRNTCGHDTVNLAKDLTGNPFLHPEDLPTGLDGITHEQLEHVIPGARLHTVPNHDTIARVLRGPGPATHAVVVDNYKTAKHTTTTTEHTTTNGRGIGAHAYLITNEHKTTENHTGTDLLVRDPALDKTHPYPPERQPHTASTEVIYLDKDGYVVPPPEHDHTFTEDRPRHNIGFDETQDLTPGVLSVPDFILASYGSDYPSGTTLHFRSFGDIDSGFSAEFTGQSVRIVNNQGHVEELHLGNFWENLRQDYFQDWSVVAPQPVFRDIQTEHTAGTEGHPETVARDDHPDPIEQYHSNRVDRLGSRASEVLEYAAAGYTRDETADKLGISPLSVRNRRGDAFKTLGVHSWEDAVEKARQQGQLNEEKILRLAQERQAAQPVVNPLNNREQQALEHIAAGHSRAHIATAFNMTPSKVKKMLAEVYKKLGVHSMQDAVSEARRRGYLNEQNINRLGGAAGPAPEASTMHYRSGTNEPVSSRIRARRNAPPEVTRNRPLVTASDGSASRERVTSGIDEFLSKSFGAEYPAGTKVYLQTPTGEIRATFTNRHVDMHYGDHRPSGTVEQGVARRVGQSDVHSLPTGAARHTIEEFWDHLWSEHKAMGVAQVRVVRSESAVPTAAFEPRRGDTSLGEHLLDQLNHELPGPTDVERTHFDEDGLAKPDPLPVDQRLENLSAEEKFELVPAVPVELPRPEFWGGEVLTLVDYNGDVTHVPTSAAVRAILRNPPDRSPYYEVIEQGWNNLRITTDLSGDFYFPPGARSGILSWNLPGARVRFYAVNDIGPVPLDVFYGSKLVGKPGDGPWRWVKADMDTQWFRVNAPTHVIPKFPKLVDRRWDPIFAAGGARSQDARQGRAGNCWLIGPLKDRAERDQQAIHDIVHNYGDGTGAVRLTVGGKPKWRRVLLQVAETPDTKSGHFVGHEPGEPLWPNMIVNAWALEFGRGKGYRIFEEGGMPRWAGEHLGQQFYRAPGGWRQQPVHNIDANHFLNPLRFDINTLHDLVGGDLEFSRAAADSYQKFAAGRHTVWDSTWQRLNALHQNDPAARDAAWETFVRTEDRLSSPGFRKYLDEQFPDTWETEKDALGHYYSAIFDGQAEHRSLPARYRDTVAGAIREQIRYAHDRNTAVMLETHLFGQGIENTTEVPGLVGGHTYRVVGNDGTKTLLENPWDHNATYPVPRPGIEYRLDPEPRATAGYITDSNGSHRTAADGTEYGIRNDGTQYRKDPDNNEYGITATAKTYRITPDGTLHERFPDGTRYWRTPDRTEYRTDPDGNKVRKQPHETDWSSDPTRVDPPSNITIPRRGGIIAVDPEHIPKFASITFNGRAARAVHELTPDGAVRTSAPPMERHTFDDPMFSGETPDVFPVRDLTANFHEDVYPVDTVMHFQDLGDINSGFTVRFTDRGVEIPDNAGGAQEVRRGDLWQILRQDHLQEWTATVMLPSPREGFTGQHQALEPTAAAAPPGPRRLTPQQQKVLEYDAAGYNGKQIQQALGLSKKAVESLRYRANQTLDARGRDGIDEALRQKQLDENFIAENQLPPNPLSDKQQQALEYIAGGFTIRETANRLSKGYTGIYSLVEHAATTLGVSDKGAYATLADAVAAVAMQRGHLSLENIADRAAELNSAPPMAAPSGASSVGGPTPKQREALEPIAAGFSVAETSKRLGKNVQKMVLIAAGNMKVFDKGEYGSIEEAAAAEAMQRGHLNIENVNALAAERNSGSHIGADGDRNTCGHDTVDLAKHLTGNNDLHPEDLPTGPDGITHEQLEHVIPNAKLHTVPDHDTIARVLRGDGPATHAVVVDNYKTTTTTDTTNSRGIGSHAYLITNNHKTTQNHTGTDLLVQDPALGKTHPYPPERQPHTASIEVIYLDKNGNIVAPPEHDHTPTTTRPPHNIGFDEPRNEPRYASDLTADVHRMPDFLERFSGADYPAGTEIHFTRPDLHLGLSTEFTGGSVRLTNPRGDVREVPISDFWGYVGRESMRDWSVSVIQPAFRDGFAERVVETHTFRDTWSRNEFLAGTAITWHDRGAINTAFVRPDDGFDLYQTHPDGTVVGPNGATRTELPQGLAEAGIHAVKITQPMPSFWHPLPPGEDSHFHALAHILGTDSGTLETQVAQHLSGHPNNTEHPLLTAAKINKLNLVLIDPDQTVTEHTLTNQGTHVFLRQTHDGAVHIGRTADNTTLTAARPNPYTERQQKILEFRAADYSAERAAEHLGIDLNLARATLSNMARAVSMTTKDFVQQARDRGHVDEEFISELQSQHNPLTERQQIALEHIQAGDGFRKIANRFGKRDTKGVRESVVGAIDKVRDGETPLTAGSAFTEEAKAAAERAFARGWLRPGEVERLRQEREAESTGAGPSGTYARPTAPESDGTAPYPSHIGADGDRNTCGHDTVNLAKHLTGNNDLHPQDLPTGLDGITHEQLENIIPNAKLHTVPNHDTIARVLRGPGPATHAIVVDNYKTTKHTTTTNSRGIGAHAYLITNNHKTTQNHTGTDLLVQDPALGKTHPYPPEHQPHTASTEVIYLDKNGHVVPPPEHDHTPTTTRPPHNIGDRPTSSFEPRDGDTYIGENHRTTLDHELDGPTKPLRPQYDHTNLDKPAPLPTHLRLKNLTPAQRAKELPTAPAWVTTNHLTMPDGSPALTLVNSRGHVLQLPAAGRMNATLESGPDGHYYKLLHSNGQYDHVPVSMVPDFGYRRGTGNRPDSVTWNAASEIRIRTFDAGGGETVQRLPYGANVVALPSTGSKRLIKSVHDTDWFDVEVPHSVLPELPELVPRHNDDLYGPLGPRPEDARQRVANDCALVAPLKAVAHHNPQLIREMLRDNGDGTVDVRLRLSIDSAFEWKRVEKSIYVTPHTKSGYFIGHEPGEPLWPAMIEKAFATYLGKGNGYAGIANMNLDVISHLLPDFYRGPNGALTQPVRFVDDPAYLHPLGMDPDSLRTVIGGDLEFSRRATDAFGDYKHQVLDLGRDDLGSPAGFRKYLDTLFPGRRWNAEKDALAEFSRAVYDGWNENRVLPPRYLGVAESVADRIDWALRRGTTVTIGTGWFGQDYENVTKVRGLVGNHAYAVLGVERDSTGLPVRLLLENPWDRHPALVPQRGSGIEHRLDPGGSDYTTDSKGIRTRRGTDGTVYRVHPNGVQTRWDPDNTTYHLAADGTRSVVHPDGTRDSILPNGGRLRHTPDGQRFWTKPDGTKLRKGPGDTTWAPDIRVDPPDTTVPRRGGVVAVDLEHLPKFSGLGMGGPGAHGLYGPDRAAANSGTTPTNSARPTGSANNMVIDRPDRPTRPIEPHDGDTYLGENHRAILDLDHELDGLTDPPRTHFDRAGYDRPPENLPVEPPIPVRVAAERLTLPDGRPALTLVDQRGATLQLPTAGQREAKLTRSPNGRSSYYEFEEDGQPVMLPESMAKDGFVFRPGTGTDPGTLAWNVEAGVRILGRDATTRAERALTVPSGHDVAALPDTGSKRRIRLPGTKDWLVVTVPHEVLPELPPLRERHSEALFGPDGNPWPQDARQGQLRDCALIAPLKAMAAQKPWLIKQMLHEYPDKKTVAVRLRIDREVEGVIKRKVEWVRVDKSIHVTPHTQSGHFAGHERGEPLWVSMVEKAVAARIGRGDGYAGIQALDLDDHSILMPDFHKSPNGALTQPSSVVDDRVFLHPFRLDDDTRLRLVGGNRDFARLMADDLDHYQQEAKDRRIAAQVDILADHPHDAAARDEAAREFLRTEDIGSRRGFRKYLDEQFPGQGRTEKDTLADFVHEMYGGETENRVLPERYRFVAEAIAERMDWALRRETPVLLGTHTFGQSGENVTAVPGLMGDHAYRLRGVQRDDEGRPIGLVLQNPSDLQHVRPPQDGSIHYRLDPKGSGYTTDANGIRFRRDPDGITYGITPDEIQLRRDPDGTVYRLEPNLTRSVEHPDGSKAWVYPSGDRLWQTADGHQFLTKANGDKLRMPPGATTPIDNSARVDPPDTTIPRSGLNLVVGLEHLPKFKGLGMSGPGAYGLYGPEKTPPHTNPITAAAVPGSDFHGHVETPTTTHIDQVHALVEGALHTAVDGHGGLRIEDVNPARRIYRVTDTTNAYGDDRKNFTVRVETQRLGDDTVARSVLNHDKGQHVIQISDRISTRHVPRALAHEIGEIVADRKRYFVDKLDAFGPEEGVLHPGRERGELRLTPHDAGRIQEMRVLGEELDRLPAARDRTSEQRQQYNNIHRDALALVDHLGLREGMPRADQRRNLVLNHLESSPDGRGLVRRLLDDAGGRQDRLSPDDLQLLHQIRRQADPDRTTFDIHRDNLRPDYPRPLVENEERVTPERAHELAEQAATRRAQHSEQTLDALRQDVQAAAPGTYPKRSIQVGGGAALAARDPAALLIDDRGRWQADPGDRIAQTADQLRNLRQTGLGDPYQFVEAGKPDARVTLDAVRYWEDTIATRGPVVNGRATFRIEDGELLADIAPPDGSTPVTVHVDGVPVVASGFPPEIILGIARDIGGMHGTYATLARELGKLNTPEATAAKTEVEALSWRDPASADKSSTILSDHGIDRSTLPSNVTNSLEAISYWTSLRAKYPGRILSGDEINLAGADPDAATEWIVAGSGGTGISGVEILLRRSDTAKFTMIGRNPAAGLADNTQWKEVRSQHDRGYDAKIPTAASKQNDDDTWPNPGATGRLTMAFDETMNLTGITELPGGRFSVNGYEGDGVIAPLGARNSVPPAVAEMVDAAIKRDPDSVSAKMLFDNDGQYLGYRITVDGHDIDVTGGASRFFPIGHLFTARPGDVGPLPASTPGTVWFTDDPRYALSGPPVSRTPRIAAQTASNRDAPPEGGNFDGGYVSTATQTTHYAAWRRSER
ncbi:LuxR C-terminal-related transcriptional regulator [Nocardia sp. NPDC051570]|uniref:WXG100-like domain-containing protein n=1 Tax=Nocardia sp. NPDC051570 TaxID=3364324 RepID=UPI00378BDB24